MDLGSISFLARLSAESRARVENWIAALPPVTRRSLLIEVCRVLDFENAKTIFAPKETRLPHPDLNLMILGWNRTLAAMLTADYSMRGIPSQESSNESLMVARSLLHQMGISSLLDKTVEMMKCGQAEADTRGEIIHVFSPSIAKSDHFFDVLEESKSAEVARHKARNSALKELSSKQVRDKMNALVFPWAPGAGRMVGYHADPELDEHYLSSIYESSLAWRNLAGLHPQTDLGGVNAGLLISIVTLLASFYLKHLYFVAVGVETLGNINWPMSLTIWKTRTELLDSLVTFTQEDEKTLSAILDRIIVTPNSVGYFAASTTPYIPMLIQVSDDQLLKPVSSIFVNPLRGIRSIMEFESPELEIRIRTPREKWMKAELDAMFAGNRYRVAPKPVMLRHNGALLTDIDASVFDVTSGCLAVFQLKWQDFEDRDVRRQRSQASNFITAVDEWGKRVKTWVKDHGLPALARSLQLPHDIASLRLFAIERQAAHFDSLGFVSSHCDLAFSQLFQNVFSDALEDLSEYVSSRGVELLESYSRSGQRLPEETALQTETKRLDLARIAARSQSELPRAEVLHELNFYLSSGPFVGGYLKTGTIFRSSEARDEKYWVCVTADCSLVPREPTDKHNRGRPIFIQMSQ